MKTKVWTGIFLLAAATLSAQTNDLTALLQQGLFEEQANRNLDAAIANYQTLALQFDKDRQLAATAVFRLGECYRAQGRTNEAAIQYQRILHDFSDQQTLAALSRQDLAGMGVGLGEATTATAAVEKATVENAEVQLWNKLKDVPKDQLEKILPTLVPDATLDTLLQQRNDAQAKLVQLRTDYAESNVVYVRQKVLLDELNRQINEKINGTMEGLRLRAELVQASRASGSSQNTGGPVPVVTSDEDQEIQRIQQMIQNSPDLINEPSGGSTPLAKAALNGWLKVAAYLLDHGAGLNVPCPKDAGIQTAGLTPLGVAVRAGNKAMTKFLIDRGANINFKDQYGDTPLHLAAQNGFQAVAEVLLASHADVNAQDNNGMTPLFWAAQAGPSKNVQMMLAAGANVNLKDSKGRTVLNYAINTPPEVTQMLLAAGTDPNTEDSDGRTPLSYAAERDNSQIVQLLLSAKANPNGTAECMPLIGAVWKKDLYAAGILLDAGADPNAVGSADFSGSFDATLMNHRQHLTPLWLAIDLHELPMVRLLLKYKADPNGTQTDGQSILFGALSETNILKELLDAGANVEAQDKTAEVNGGRPDWTPLAAAAWERRPGAVEVLLGHEANPNADDALGDRPLHWAISLVKVRLTDQDRDAVKLLLDHQADPNVRNQYGDTPLDCVKRRLAQSDDSSDKTVASSIVDLLRRHGALDKLPDWDCITVARPVANFSFPLFRQGTNDWNQFTLLEMVLNFYESSQTYSVSHGNYSSAYSLKSMLPFPDLAHIAIVRPSHNSTNLTRLVVNLLNVSNGIDCSKDLPLEFGDVVEIPERDHALGENSGGLTQDQTGTLVSYTKGNARLVAHGQSTELAFHRLGNEAVLGSVLQQSDTRNFLMSSSDLARVKVTRRDPKSGKTHEWTLDYSPLNSPSSVGTSPVFYQWGFNGNNAPLSQDLWLRDGDVIEVPEKP